MDLSGPGIDVKLKERKKERKSSSLLLHDKIGKKTLAPDLFFFNFVMLPHWQSFARRLSHFPIDKL
jgi:hypothetical protein